MPLPLVANTARVTQKYFTDNQLTENVLYFTNPGGITDPAQLSTLASAVNVWFGDFVLPLLSEDVVYGATIARDLSTNPGFQAEVSFGPENGGVSSEAAPNNVCAVPSFRTGISGRSFHGRNYLSGIPNVAINVNVIDSTFIGNVIAAYGQLLTGGGVGLDGFVWSVVSYYSAGALRAAGLSTPVSHVIFTDSIVDSQRRRLPGRGR